MNNIDYTYFIKDKFNSISELNLIHDYDHFISFNSETERVLEIFNHIKSTNKIWIAKELNLFISYQNHFILTGNDNNDANNFIDNYSLSKEEKICIDITGFPVTFLFLFLKNLQFKGITKFDVIYTEPSSYNLKEHTKFSDDFIEVKQIEGFEGIHNTSDDSNDFLIIALGYDHSRIIDVCKNKSSARKVQLFGLPSLQPDFYQQNIIKTEKAAEELGNPNFNDFDFNIFAPANDPFVTAQKLKLYISKQNKRKEITNIYLSPLSTKAQALGFALYFLWECEDKPISIIYPFCNKTYGNTSKGISNISLFQIELPLSTI
jgi:hypothetical protein